MPNRVYLLVQRESLFHPAFFARVLDERPGDFAVMGAAMIPSRVTLRQNAEFVFRMAGVPGLARLAARTLIRAARLNLLRSSQRSVRVALANHGVPVDEALSPNDHRFIAMLKTKAPDIVFCAVPNILKKPILDLPRLGCVNRHAGRLPDYRGVEPVFHALRRGQTTATVTYHKMTLQIDGGTVLWEHHEPVAPRDSVFAVYQRLFSAAALGFWPAMRSLVAGAGREIRVDEGHYFRKPTRAQVLEFQRTRHRYL